MIIVKKSGYLQYKNLKFRCALGKAGIKKKEKEGDNVTPKGIYKILKVFYRKDRVKKIKTPFEQIIITKKIGWCDDIKSKYYIYKKNCIQLNGRRPYICFYHIKYHEKANQRYY